MSGFVVVALQFFPSFSEFVVVTSHSFLVLFRSALRVTFGEVAAPTSVRQRALNNEREAVSFLEVVEA